MILVNRTLLCSTNIYKTFSLCVLNKINQQYRNIMSWEQKKANFLTMKTEDKCKDFIMLETIKTWGEHAKSAKLGAKLDVKPEHSINASKNKILVNKISIFEGDITKLEVDSIVNAANSSLMGGGGVDGAIHRAAGKSLQDECKTLGGCPEGEARITGGYNLPSKYVIHTVGPKGEKTKVLENCYKHSLDLMLKNKLRSIAFPCIATGIYGYPNDAACYVAVNEVRKFLETNADNVDRVIFCLFMDVDKAVYGKVLQSYFPLE